MRDVFVPQRQKENAKVFQHIPRFVAQQRVSERTAKRTLEVCTAERWEDIIGEIGFSMPRIVD